MRLILLSFNWIIGAEPCTTNLACFRACFEMPSICRPWMLLIKDLLMNGFPYSFVLIPGHFNDVSPTVVCYIKAVFLVATCWCILVYCVFPRPRWHFLRTQRSLWDSGMFSFNHERGHGSVGLTTERSSHFAPFLCGIGIGLWMHLSASHFERSLPFRIAP